MRKISDEEFPDHFWSRVQKGTQPDACWLWQGCRNRLGYGSVGRYGKTFLAHRVAYEIAVGPIPEGLIVRHECDTPGCVRPDHLAVGTHTDNMRDMHARGRQVNAQRRGAAHGNAKLTDEQVQAIRAATGRQKDIGEAFGVTQVYVSRIRRMKSRI